MPHLNRALLPTTTEVLVYLTISLVLLLGINLVNVADVLLDPSLSRLSLSFLRDQAHSFVSVIDDQSFTSPISLAFFWGLAGLVFYVIIATVYELYIETRHDLAEASSKLQRPAYDSSGSERKRALIHLLLRLGAAIGLIIMCFAFVGLVLPLSVQLVYDVVYVGERPAFLLNPLFGIIMTVLSLHIFVLLVRTLFLRARMHEQLEVGEV